MLHDALGRHHKGIPVILSIRPLVHEDGREFGLTFPDLHIGIQDVIEVMWIGDNTEHQGDFPLRC